MPKLNKQAILLPEATEFTQAITHLNQQFDKATILLYGSYAKNSYGCHSDIDILVFTHVKDKNHQSGDFNQHPLDAWIYPLESIENIDEYLHIYPFVVIRDDFQIANTIMDKILQERKIRTIKLQGKEKQRLIAWIEKMLQRAGAEGVKAQYRYITLLNDFPELYCQFKGIYFDGPMKTIELLEKDEIELFEIYSKLLLNPKNHQLLKDLYAELLNSI